ncbi:MAG: putative membrane protein YfcA, partial [Akkermansiaceae bacterium]
GSIFAVPLLVYGLHAGVREAVGVSLAAVGSTALFGALIRVSALASYFFSGDSIPLRLTATFVGGGLLGMLGGNWCHSRINDLVLKRIFAGCMGIVAAAVLFRR